ncbi:MAG: glycosyltransferase family 4 protein [Candidatus Pacebacteria bacterium]|nr:glycosyltransferase family 4 protein [Candidatus Paceibacterota bacterium]
MKKLRIAQVVSLQESVPPKGKNGLEFVVHYLTEELVKRGHNVSLFATKDSKTSAKLIDVLPYPAAKKRIFGWGGIDYSLVSLTKAIETQNEFDIIHIHIGQIAYYFANLIKTPMIETIHSPISKVPKKYLPKKDIQNRYLKDSRSRYKKMHHIFVSKNQKKNAFMQSSGSVIYNGIDLEEFKFKKDPQDYFLYLGYITPDKGAHLAVKAARRARVKLKLAGSYRHCEKYFEEEIEPYLKKGKIEYVGVVNPIQRNRLLGGAKAILVPVQWEEPFGLIMTEAMACGTPVIGFDKAAVSEIVKDKKTGFIVKDFKEMAKAIRKVEEIDRSACRARVEKYFSVEKMVDGYERVYEKMVRDFRK